MGFEVQETFMYDYADKCPVLGRSRGWDRYQRVFGEVETFRD